MKLPVTRVLMAALAIPMAQSEVAAAPLAAAQLTASLQVGQFHAQRQGRAFWFASDDPASALLGLVERAELDDLDPSRHPATELRELAARARTGTARDRMAAEAAFSAVFARYAADVARERNVGTLYVDPGARPRPVTPARLLRVAASAPSLAAYVEEMRWMHPYYPALRSALDEEMKGANDADRARLLALNRNRARVLPRG